MKNEHRLKYFQDIGLTDNMLLDIAILVDEEKRLSAVKLLRLTYPCELLQAANLVTEIHKLIKL